MRATKSLTMLDPFQKHYGKYTAIFLFVPALCGEIFWTAAILNALGKKISKMTPNLGYAILEPEMSNVPPVRKWGEEAGNVSV